MPSQLTPKGVFNPNSPKEWWDFLSNKPGALIWGGVEILCLGSHDPTAVTAACAQMLAACTEPDNLLAFDRIHVVFPPTQLDQAQRFYEILTPEGSRSTASEVQALRERVKQRIIVHQRSDLDGHRLINQIRLLGARSAVIIINSDIYDIQAPAPSSPNSFSSETKRDLPEDARFKLEDWQWSDRIARLAEAIVGEISDKQVMAFLLSAQYAPVHSDSTERILGVERTGVTFQTPSYMQILGAREREWSEKLRQGDTDSILSEIDKLQLDTENRALLKAQVLFSAGAPRAGFETIEPHIQTLEAEAPPNLIVKAAIIAYQAGRHDVSLRLLHLALAKQIDEEALFKMAIGLSHSLGAEAELRELRSQVAKLLPFSNTALHEAFSVCSSSADFDNFIRTTTGIFRERQITDDGLLLLHLARAFAKDAALDIDSLVEGIGQDLPHLVDRAAIAAARYELDRGRPRNAADICLDFQWKAGTSVERTAILLLLDAIEGILLRLDEPKTSEDSLDVLVAYFRHAAAYLHTHPADNWLRLRLAEVVSPHITGSSGYSILGHMAVRGTRPEARGAYEHPASAEPVPDEDYAAFFRRVLEAAQVQGISLLGQGVLPDTAGYSERRLLDHTWRTIHAFDMAGADDEHCDILVKLLYTGLLLANRVARPGESAELISHVAASLSLSGYQQMARDLAEHILVMVPADEDELVAAWLEYAEVYLRIHRPHEAIAWLNVALSRMDRLWPPAAVCNGALLAARILRDLSMYELALEAVQWAREVAAQTGLHDHVGGRIDFVEDSIQANLLHHEGVRTAEDEKRLSRLGERLVVRLAEERKTADEVLPIATLLASVVMVMAAKGLDTSKLKDELKETAALLRGHARTLLLSLIDPPATPEAIAVFARGLHQTRDAVDAASDVAFIPILARNALGRGEDASAAEQLTLLEWLTDRSIQAPRRGAADAAAALQGRNEIARALVRGEAGGGALKELQLLQGVLEEVGSNGTIHAPPGSDFLTAFAEELSARGVDVHSFALSESAQRKLALVSAVDGEISNVTVPSIMFEAEAFHRWSKKYPHGYRANGPDSGYDLNDFERTLRGIELPLRDTDNTALLIPEARLQILPPNLILANGVLSGLSRPMASAPSLTWLRSIRESTERLTGRRIAWIPLSKETDKNGSIIGTALNLLKAGTEIAMSDGGFEVFLESEPPSDLQGADVAIIGAHGAVHKATDWFRVVSDEEHLRLSPTQIADALLGTKLVILFICSGGRLDAHPFASAAMGLPQMLLGRGCHAVLASPWPLDVSVPSYWLPAFLGSWDGGATVAEANFLANNAVAHNYSFHPSHRLAMNLFGDPLLRTAQMSAG